MPTLSAQAKVCRACHAPKPVERFARKKDGAGGRRAVCTTCEGRQAYARNPERVKRATRKWQATHPEHRRELKRASNRRRHGRAMDGPGVPVEEYRALMQLFDGKCAYCRDGVATTMDHVTPLSRGGKHEAANLLPACARCNFQKHHKTLSEWAKEK